MKIAYISRLVRSVVSVYGVTSVRAGPARRPSGAARACPDQRVTHFIGRHMDRGHEAEHLRLGPGTEVDTLTILKDTPQLLSWRVEGVDDQGKPFSYSWSGPKDGTMHPIKGQDGGQIGEESAKEDHDALIRRGGDATEGSSFEGHATMSADGNTLTDVIATKAKDGKTTTGTTVMHRAPPGR